MSEKYTKEKHEAYRQEQDEKAAKEEEARNERMEKENARRSWIADRGTETAFDKAWPSLRDEGRRQRVLHADKHARELQRNGLTSRI